MKFAIALLPVFIAGPSFSAVMSQTSPPASVSVNLTGPITSVGMATTIVGPVPTAAIDLSTVTTALALKAPLASPTFTGVVTAPTIGGAVSFTSTTTALGVTDGTNAKAGYVGEVIVSSNSADQIPAASGVYVAVTTITLTAGDWDVQGTGAYSVSSSVATETKCSISNSNTTADDSSAGYWLGAAHVTADIMTTPIRRINITGSTDYYLICAATYPGGLGSAIWVAYRNVLRARRMR